jgi:hypothetical protein
MLLVLVDLFLMSCVQWWFEVVLLLEAGSEHRFQIHSAIVAFGESQCLGLGPQELQLHHL